MAGRWWHDFAVRLKHWLLDLLHPLPARTVVCLGAPGSLESAIVREVIKRTHVPGLEEVSGSKVHVVVDEDSDPVEGWGPVCRYLGRLGRTYPTTPASALVVDGALDTLAQMAAALEHGGPPKDVVSTFVEMLEEGGFEEGEVWLMGMDAPSVADACWKGALRWAQTAELWDAAGDGNVREWWRSSACD